jgi:hypothetical protein
LKSLGTGCEFHAFIFVYTFSELAGLITEIVKVAITPFQPQKLVGDDTLESGAYHCAFGRPL